VVFVLYRLVGYEGLEFNSEGGTEDSEEEAKRGRWKQEVHYFLHFVCTVLWKMAEVCVNCFLTTCLVALSLSLMLLRKLTNYRMFVASDGILLHVRSGR
jgi:hypothetical protein